MADASKPPTFTRKWIVRDELGRPVARVGGVDRDAAIRAFCYPALRAEAYFGPGSAWRIEPDPVAGAQTEEAH